MSDVPPLIHLGTVTGTHGILGGLRVRTFSGEYEVLASLKTLFLKRADGEMKLFDVYSVRGQGRHAVLALKGFDTIDQAAGLAGSAIYIERKQLPPLEEGEHYWCDIIGMTVLLEDGTVLGQVTSIIPTGSNDVYVVKMGKREVLVPAIESVILDIDTATGTMRVNLLEGLLDE
jgi:16S rRNA processing protein RimM